MVGAAFLALLLATQCPPDGPVTVAPNIDCTRSAFVMEIAGSAIDSQLAGLADTRIEQTLSTGDKITITLNRVTADGYGMCCRELRVISNVTVKLEVAGCPRTSQATLLIGAWLNVTVEPGKPLTLDIVPDPAALAATDDGENSAAVESAILEVAPAIAQKMTVSIPLEGLEALALARPPGAGPVEATAYELGFSWVLQMYGPLGTEACVPPSLFLQGDTFTLVMTRQIVHALADYEFQAGHIPSRMSEDGLIDPKGTVHVEGISTNIEPDVLTVDWAGVTDAGCPVNINWRLKFAETAAGVGLEIKEIIVNGESKAIPKGEIHNPVDELIKTIAAGPKRVGLFAGPLGRMRLTQGAISAESLMVAGRV